MTTIGDLNSEQIGRSSKEGSATLLALFMLVLLSFIGATVLMNTGRLYNGNEKVQGWQEALYAAEMGADIGLANVRWKVVGGSPTAFDTTSSPAWTVDTTNPNNTVYTYTTAHMTTQGGEGTYETWAVITVDSPVGDNTTNPPSGLTDSFGHQWYRVRSTGHARLPGLQRVSNDILSDPNARHNNTLHKFNMRKDRATGAALSIPEATRTVEQILKPKSGAGNALTAQTLLDLSAGNQIVDSYDSSDPTKSTNGAYDPAKRQNHGNVAYNGSSLKGLLVGAGEKVYGNATTNGGSFTDPNNTIQAPGVINNSVSANLPVVPYPTWGTAGQPAINTAVTTVSKTAQTITINSDSTKNYYKLADIDNDLTVALGAGVTTGTLNIWLTGGASTSGTITIPVGANVKIFFTGDTFHPQNDTGINNLNKDPSTFQIYGCGTDPGSGPGIDIHVGASSTANFYGTVYAPYRYVNLKYDAKAANAYGFYGSFVGSTIIARGPVHYDESAGGLGPVVDYVRSSYVEDPR